MRAASLTNGATANLGGAKTCTDFPETCTVSLIQMSITDLLKAKFPLKTWTFVSEFFGLKERAAKHRLANARCYTIEELQVLLQSEDGIDFLVAIMGDAQPQWWRWMTKVMTLAAVRRRQAEDQQEILKLETSKDVEVGARRRIKGALNADRNLSAAIARAETAVGFQRPDRDRGMVDVSRAGARISDRAVAAAGRRGR